MPAVDPKKLKRLMVNELLVPYAMKRRLSAGPIGGPSAAQEWRTHASI